MKPVALLPESSRVPVPSLVRLYAALTGPMAPPTVHALAPLMVIVRLAFIITAPVPRFKELVPVNIKSAFQFIKLLLDNVTPAVVLSIITPVVAMVNAPVPSAVLLLMFKVPPLRVVPPL